MFINCVGLTKYAHCSTVVIVIKYSCNVMDELLEFQTWNLHLLTRLDVGNNWLELSCNIYSTIITSVV